MVARAQEQRVQRRLLDAYISSDVSTIVIERPSTVRTAAGGVAPAHPILLDPQRVRLVPFKRRLTAVTVNTPDGDIHNLEYVLIAHHDADVKKGDWFTWDGGRYEVISLEPHTTYRQAWNITYRGPTDGP